ncbi:MAG: type VI secretion system tip protein VgrG [Lewinellaceae bacterium]|nr:type VI secretion system tip protein VgrG [Lewinellaceae bacterium]
MLDLNLSQLLPPLPDDTSLVSILVKINGQPIPDTIQVMSLSVVHCANRIPFACITILDGDVATQRFDSSDLDLLSPGKQIEILAGYHGDNKSIFKGIIVRHSIKIPQEDAPAIEIECKDESVKLTAGRKNKYFFNQKDNDIIESILRSAGVQTDVAASTVRHKEMVQYFATDWDFVVTRAEANGMLVLANAGKVTVKKPDFGQAPKFALNYGSSIYEFEAEMDARDQYPTAEATTWSPADQALQNAAPGGGSLGLNLPGSGPNTDFSSVMGLRQYPLQHGGNFTTEEAQAWAKAQMTKSELAKKRGRVKFNGVADIKPGDCINLQGVGGRHSGKVLVTAVTHEIGEGAWFTHAQFGLSRRWFAEEHDDVADMPASGLLPAIHGLQIGIVTRLKGSPADPEFRVQVRLPLVDGSGDGIWSRLTAQDAGNNRGAVWRPEINDEVVVGFLNDDPRQAIVLGALHSSKNAAPIPADDQNHQKGWVTRSNMKLVFNDDDKSIIIETPAGKKVTIDEKANLIRIEDEHRNKITMDQSGIVIESGKDLTLKATQNIKLEGVNIENKAQASFKADSQGQAQLQATADVVVKGTFVRIN